MAWIETLDREFDFNYKAARTLMRMVRDDELGWKPESPPGAEGTGWMTMGQLLLHITEACGKMCECFAKEDWSILTAGQPGSPMPSVPSVAEALRLLDADEALARRSVREAGEERLRTERVKAPWEIEGTLGQQMLDSAKHLQQHKGQLFYYLKLLGRPVHTGHLWGME
jgi:uncharacterized damage-inducible protein DinB